MLLSYGIAIASVPLIASQATALLSVGLTLSLAARHRRRGLGLRDGALPSDGHRGVQRHL